VDDGTETHLGNGDDVDDKWGCHHTDGGGGTPIVVVSGAARGIPGSLTDADREKVVHRTCHLGSFGFVAMASSNAKHKAYKQVRRLRISRAVGSYAGMHTEVAPCRKLSCVAGQRSRSEPKATQKASMPIGVWTAGEWS